MHPVLSLLVSKLCFVFFFARLLFLSATGGEKRLDVCQSRSKRVRGLTEWKGALMVPNVCVASGK